MVALPIESEVVVVAQKQCDHEAETAMATGKRHLICGEVQEAVDTFSQVCEMLSTKYGQTSEKLATPYLYYGKALLKLARVENGVLGHAVKGSDAAFEEKDTVESLEDEMSAAADASGTKSTVQIEEVELSAAKVKEIHDEVQDAMRGDNVYNDQMTEDEATEDEDQDRHQEKESTENKSKHTKSDSTSCEQPKDTDEPMDEDVPMDKCEDAETEDTETEDTEAEDTEAEDTEAEDSFAEEIAEEFHKSDQKKVMEDGSKNLRDRKTLTTASSELPLPTYFKSEEGYNSQDDHEYEPEAGEAVPESTEHGDDVSSMQLAWEMLELAFKIFTQIGCEACYKQAECKHMLGEVSMEKGDYSQAVEDFSESYELQKKGGRKESDRRMAESCYSIGLSYSFDKKFPESIAWYRRAVASLEARTTHLEEKLKRLACEEYGEPSHSEMYHNMEKECDELKDLVVLDMRAKIEDVELSQKHYTDSINVMKTYGKDVFTGAHQNHFDQEMSSNATTISQIDATKIQKKRKSGSTEEATEAKKKKNSTTETAPPRAEQCA